MRYPLHPLSLAIAFTFAPVAVFAAVEPAISAPAYQDDHETILPTIVVLSLIHI